MNQMMLTCRGHKLKLGVLSCGSYSVEDGDGAKEAEIFHSLESSATSPLSPVKAGRSSGVADQHRSMIW